MLKCNFLNVTKRTNVSAFRKSCYLIKHSCLVSLTPAGSIGFLIQARSAPVFQRDSSIWGEWVQLDDARYKPLGCRRNESTNDPTIYQVCMSVLLRLATIKVALATATMHFKVDRENYRLRKYATS